MDFLVNEIIRNLNEEEINQDNNSILATKLNSNQKDNKTKCC